MIAYFYKVPLYRPSLGKLRFLFFLLVLKTHYSTKKRQRSFDIVKAFFVRHSSEYETSVVTERLTEALSDVL